MRLLSANRLYQDPDGVGRFRHHIPQVRVKEGVSTKPKVWFIEGIVRNDRNKINRRAEVQFGANSIFCWANRLLLSFPVPKRAAIESTALFFIGMSPNEKKTAP
jgi:hypothetical protein